MFAPDTACDREARGPISINLPVYKLERAADVSDFTEKEIRNGKGKEGGEKHGARNSLDEDSLHSARVQTGFRPCSAHVGLRLPAASSMPCIASFEAVNLAFML